LIEKIFAALAGFVMSVIQGLGYGGVALLMAIERACIPLPSEVIMPFSGFLVSKGAMNLWGVSLAGAVGCVLGSVLAYYVGAWGGRPLVEKYGKFVLISHHDLEIADRFFDRWGQHAVFIGRLLPVIRTFIAFPAGVSRMRMAPFLVYTFVGSFIWSLGLAYVGVVLGDNWDTLKVYFHRFDAVIAAVIVVGAIWWIWRHIRSNRGTETGDRG
jgi:membrane protein DedA with SNARE-associated domain